MTAFESLTRLGRLRRLRTIAAEALRGYDLPQYRLALQADSFNTMFRVSCVDATYLLRVGPARTIHEPGAARAEHEWTRSLSAQGLRVPTLVLAVDQAASVFVTAAGVPGSRECTLLTWRPGRPLRRPLTHEDIVDLAALCATLHNTTAPTRDRPDGVLDGRRVLHFRLPNRIDDASLHRDVFRDAQARAEDASSGAIRPPRPDSSTVT